ncbi:MAG: methyl-accepting chemotaxis protein [Clostridiales bacterium]|jgi:methyl-accepting chemotaxis protein|nr:methyl-accepting chemotaxis protein [Clostridiales bacterium]
MFSSLKSKLIIPIILSFVVMITAIVIFVSIETHNLAGDMTDKRVDLAAGTVEARLADFEDISRLTAMNIANDSGLITNLLRWNADLNPAAARDELMSFLNEMRTTFEVSSFMLVGADGNVVLRTHVPANYGDSVLANPHVASALGGNPVSVYISVAGVPVGITSVMPIWHAGTIVGTLSANVNMATEAFVDDFARVFDARVMIFQDGESVMASPVAGRRDIGAPLLDEVLDDVMAGQSIVAEMAFDGIPYHGYFHPLVGAGGNVMGVLFLGFSDEAVVAAVSQLQITLIIIGAIALILASGLMFILIVRSLRPLAPLAQNITDVANGNFNVNINRAAVKNDEIGRITTDVGNLIDVTKSLVDDLAKFAHINKVEGDIEYRIDPNKYQGGYKDMILSLNEQVDDFTDGVVMLLGALGNINKGNFYTELRTLPGKKIVLNQTADALMSNLANVKSEINAMIDAAANKGDLSFKIDENKYEGDWREIMLGLNSISTAVDVPLRAIKVALREMQAGFFDMGHLLRRIGEEGLPTDPAEYRGVFGEIVGAVNATMAEISSYITEISESLEAMADGNMTITINRDYVGNFAAMKESLNHISGTLNRTLSDIFATSDQVLSGAKQISVSAVDLANGANQQASSVQELNASIEMINKQTRQNAQSAQEANSLSNRSTENAQAGNDAMRRMSEAMQEIKDSSGNISKIIKTIQDIAFQTNLLALNASVEAARAGEHGKGFAVVAEEVRSLAARSQTAAEETTILIADSIRSVDNGSEIAQTTADALNIIVDNADEVLQIINSISASSKEQADAVGRVSVGLGQISSVVQSNSAVSEEAAAASEELTSQAELLRQLVSYFKI